MRKVTIPLWLTIALIAAAATSQWWIKYTLVLFQNILSFINTRSDLIQGLEAFIQLILWIFAAGTILFSLVQRKFPPSISLPWKFSTSGNTPREIDKLKRILKYICNLHRTEYILNYWHKIYIIDAEGGLKETEKISIAPLSNRDKVFFWLMDRGVYHNSVAEGLVKNAKAKNTANNHQLEIVELHRERKKIEYAIILDPAATDQVPVEVEIESDRPGIFRPLIDKLEDEGGFRIEASSVSKAKVTIIAPDSIEITSFSISPKAGDDKIIEKDGHSCLTWTATNLQHSLYTYVIQARKT